MNNSIDLSELQIPIKEISGGKISSSYLGEKKGVMVLFYADWCSHCKYLKPVYKEFYEENKNGDVLIKVVDMVSDGKKANENLLPLTIGGFPTILSFDNKGRYFSTFNGKRTKENLKNFYD